MAFKLSLVASHAAMPMSARSAQWLVVLGGGHWQHEQRSKGHMAAIDAPPERALGFCDLM
jgi:hypothetical protein